MRRGMPFAACTRLLHSIAVHNSHSHILVIAEDLGSICILLGIPVWVFMTVACLRLQMISTGTMASRRFDTRFDTVPAPSQRLPTGYQPYQCSDLHSVQAVKPKSRSKSADQRSVALSNVDQAKNVLLRWQ